MDLRGKALKLLSQREHSRTELRRKLGGSDVAREELDALLDELVERNWQSDARFAIAYVDANAARFGRYRLQNELRERGVADALIADALAQLPAEDDELSRAREVWRKKFREVPTDPAERARQARFMQARGFAYDTIRKVLGGLDED
ncbi:recombination regulator RecX [Chitinimonas viridis]|uniref:Regulatory protein RecX n=2 Tax=Chitinimonas TaxID=240411 RepID=A0ABT8B3P8_9NEIS|nr:MULTISPECIES: recombination regulator RecX [Chitinimonas]MDN3576887.1 recombination regulator RecX [Chitinimonas viridis]GLR13793.1 regulatory protein RecX [Chitinimonas prasina]